MNLREDGILDPLAIERALTGTGCPVVLTTRERHRVVRELTGRGVPYREIARRCGVTVETIRRDRLALGLVADGDRGG